MNLVIRDSFNIPGRGQVFLIETSKNEIDPANPWEIKNKTVCVNDKKYIVTGIETWALPKGAKHKIVGLLVKRYE